MGRRVIGDAARRNRKVGEKKSQRQLVGSRFAQYMPPAIEVLKGFGGKASIREVSLKLIDALQIPQSERDKTHKSGTPIVENDIGWALSALRFAGLADTTGSGQWTLTPKGFEANLTLNQAQEIARERSRAYSARVRQDIPVNEELYPADEEPKDKLDLLSVMKGLSPRGFELLAQRILREAGFEDVIVQGGPGDGGIDGEGKLRVNEFVSHKVRFQCKRYSGAVVPEDVRKFRGSVSHTFDKYILITTGRFTDAAEKEAVLEGRTPIELIDGEKLVGLMQRLRLGVRLREEYDVDEVFFDQFR